MVRRPRPLRQGVMLMAELLLVVIALVFVYGIVTTIKK